MDNSLKITYKKMYVNKTIRNNNWDMPTHTHNYDEIYYLIDGGISYFIGDCIYEMKPGDIAYIPKNVIHKSFSGTNFSHERYVINVPDGIVSHDLIDFLQTKVFLCPIATLDEKQRAKIERILTQMEYEQEKEDEFSEKICKNLFFEFVATLIRLSKKAEIFIRSEVQKKDVIMTICTYIEQEYNFDIRLSQIAARVGFSEAYVSRLFKRKTGMNYTDYLTNVRILKAADMLRKTDKAITEIATECGFNNSNYFADRFKKIKKMTPLKYRKLPSI